MVQILSVVVGRYQDQKEKNEGQKLQEKILAGCLFFNPEPRVCKYSILDESTRAQKKYGTGLNGESKKMRPGLHKGCSHT
jgi:hypothetical protein